LPNIVEYCNGISGSTNLFYLPCVVYQIKITEVIYGKVNYLFPCYFIKYKKSISCLRTNDAARA